MCPSRFTKSPPNYSVKPFVTSLMNPTGLALDRAGNLFVSCRHDGTIHRITPDGRSRAVGRGHGRRHRHRFRHATDNLFVGDRSGTIFKISPSREIFVFATLEPSVAAYHLAFHPSGDLFVTGPTTSSFDRVYRVIAGRRGQQFFSAASAGRKDWRLIATAISTSPRRHRGTPRHRAHHPAGEAEVALSGSGLVGLALLPSGRAIVATTDALFTLDWEVRGLPLNG